ncbi:MAG: hypothetical protein RBR59_06940 [Sulfurimonadaceae bacterium]|jgi:hypothetical protein|nr:hypothetical protein [Sulfurimonadaceae bacterium]
MKKIILFLALIVSISFAEATPVKGLERASAQEQRDACKEAKRVARENYNIVDINVGCTCEKSSPHQWSCFVGFTHIPK